MIYYYPIYFIMLCIIIPGVGLAYSQTQVPNPLENKKVLILNAFESNIPAFEKTDHGLSVVLQSGGIPIKNQVYEHLELRRNPSPEHRELMVELLRQRYGGKKIDLVITLYPDALKLLLEECQAIFPNVPVLALYLPQGFKFQKTERNIIKHLVIPDFKPTIDVALHLVPGVKRVYVVSGTHPLDTWLENLFMEDSKGWKDKLEFRYLTALSLDEILATAANAPSDSILFITAFGKDVNGKHRTTVEVSRLLAQASKIPIFGSLDILLNNGIVGGSLLNLENVGRKAGETALKMLSDAAQTESIPAIMEIPQSVMFDWRELRHWNLNESELPKDSVIINREFSLWDLKYYTVGALAFIMAQSFLIAGLLWHRRRRKSAEEELKTQLQFETLLSEISTGFINLPTEQIDSAIQDAQARFCEGLDLDFAALWQVSDENPDFIYLTHFYRRLEGPQLPDRMDGQGYFPWCLQQVSAGKVIAVSTEAAPPEAALDQEMWRHYGIKSSLVFPLSIGGSLLIGALSFNTMRKERTWPEQLVKQLQLLAQVFANTIARKRADHVLRESETRLTLATTAAGTGLWIMDLETEEVWVSEKTRELFHFTPDEDVTYETFFKKIHPDDHGSVHQAVQHTLQSGEKLRCDYRIILPDGTIQWIVTHGQRYPDTKPVRLMGVSLDITDRLKAEAEARQQWEQLAHVARIGIMGELTSSLAHEINQPLTAIQSNAEAAQRFLSGSEPDTDEVREILEDIIRDNTRASDIIRKIRALLKREPIPFAVLDLNALIHDVLSLLRADSLLQELVITPEFSQGLPPVSADRIQIQQVLINLILNGAAAMKHVPSARRKLNIKTAIHENRTVKVSVADFGTGIDENAIDRLFEPFFTTKPEGLGMGLAISRTIINAHGGTMEASNNPEGGATFAFTLPIHQGGAS